MHVEGLRAHFHDPVQNALVPALEGVDVEIRGGRCLGVTGESGGGKSTLARGLVGLVRGTPGITGGTFRIGGEQVLGDYPQDELPIEGHWRSYLFRHWQRTYGRRLGRLRGGDVFFIAQDPRSALNPYLTVGRQIAECLTGSSRRDRARELLEEVSLPASLYTRYPHELSTGMCQRVVVAIALALPCRIVLADEPVSKLDLRIRRRIIDLLARIPESGRALVLFTHQLDLIRHLADEVMVLFRGTVVEQGASGAIFDPSVPHHPYTEQLTGAYAGRVSPISETPLAAQAPGGCSYQLRCPLDQIDRCATEDPPFGPLGETHVGRCWVRIEP